MKLLDRISALGYDSVDAGECVRVTDEGRVAYVCGVSAPDDDEGLREWVESLLACVRPGG